MTLATPISGSAQKCFLQDVKGKLRSKFGEDRSKTELTMLAIEARWTDTGRTDAKVNLYSVQCCRLHWTDKNSILAIFPTPHRDFAISFCGLRQWLHKRC